MAQHDTRLYGWDGRDGMERLAWDVGDLRYDALAEFFENFAGKLTRDATLDEGRGRPQLAEHLRAAADAAELAHQAFAKAWKLCEPYMNGTKRVTPPSS